MRRPLLVAALVVTACGPASPPPSPPPAPPPANRKSEDDVWSCFGLRFALGYDGLHTSMCQKTLASCEEAAKSFATGEGKKILIPTTECSDQPYAICYMAYGKDGKEIFQCTRNELDCRASQELQSILGNRVGSSCQLATKEPLTTAEHRWYCFRASGPGGGSALCEPAKVACEATRAGLTGGKLDVSACTPLETEFAYCAEFGQGNAMCTPTEDECIDLRMGLAPTMSVPVAACRATKATCSSSAEDGAHCAKPAPLSGP
jgi:hypothetical protein